MHPLSMRTVLGGGGGVVGINEGETRSALLLLEHTHSHTLAHLVRDILPKQARQQQHQHSSSSTSSSSSASACSSSCSCSYSFSSWSSSSSPAFSVLPRALWHTSTSRIHRQSSHFGTLTLAAEQSRANQAAHTPRTPYTHAYKHTHTGTLTGTHTRTHSR